MSPRALSPSRALLSSLGSIPFLLRVARETLFTPPSPRIDQSSKTSLPARGAGRCDFSLSFGVPATFRVPATSSLLLHLRASQPHEITNFFDCTTEILHNFVVGEPQHGIAAERQFVVAMPVAYKCPSRRVVRIAVKLDHEPPLHPD